MVIELFDLLQFGVVYQLFIYICKNRVMKIKNIDIDV